MRRFAALLAFLLLTLPAAADSPTISWTWRPVSSTVDPGKAEFERACSICHGSGPDRPRNELIANPNITVRSRRSWRSAPI